ncbi:glycosyltransferase family 4 protein [Shewanella intestini]|uniref:Glycosyltransferase family 4 protein n=1 Tax=Shewanella intestini TaxID=2017544 RepID=A0ABS5I3F0_9GAMM|nr:MULTISPECIES: glycosyltransferase family 4 protein [Shewanella]MBR9728204.1 glycosyltransferase family 4 protein [Shewanella intestini]
MVYVINAGWYFELHWLERAREMISNGFKVSVIVPNCQTDTLVSLNGFGIDVYQIKMSRTGVNPFGEISYLHKLSKTIGALKPDIVHSVTIKPNLYSSIICTLRGIRHVSTYAGLGTLKVRPGIISSCIRKITFGMIRKFSRCNHAYYLFENNEDKDYFVETGIVPENRSIRVYGAGVNISQYSYSSVPVDTEEFKVFFASRLLKDKGLNFLVDAVKKLNVKGYKVTLYIAGIFDNDSPLSYTESEIDTISKLPFVTWLGQRNDIPLLIESSDVVCLPTTYGEGVPRILIESASVGRPIITTPLGGCKDICKDGFNGFIAAEKSSEDIADKLELLINNYPLRKRFGENGRKLVEDKFTNKSVMKQHFDIYEKVINE